MLFLPLFIRPLLGLMLFTSACSQAEGDNSANATADQPQAIAQTPKGKKGKKGGHKKDKGADLPAGLRSVGRLTDGILESSGLCAAPEAGTYLTFGDDGQQPFVYRVDATGQQVGQFTLGAPNHDWESLSRDNRGNYFMGDCGNNNNDRRNLAILRFRPEQPNKVEKINFSYPDQTEFPPSKSERNFDCEASLWHAGQVYLFTKDRAQSSTCKVYTVPETPGTYKAKLITKLAIPGQVTECYALAERPPPSAAGPARTVHLGRRFLGFYFEGNAPPHRPQGRGPNGGRGLLKTKARCCSPPSKARCTS